MRDRSSGRAEAALVAITIVWGMSFTIVKDALADVSTLVFLALRFALASVALGLAGRGRLGRAAISPLVRRASAVTGGALFLGYYFQTAGLRLTTASKSAFLTSLCTVLVPFFAACVYRVAPRPWEVGGVLVAFGGMALLTWPAETLRLNAGDLLTVACAAAFAAHIVLTGHYAPRTGVAAFSFLQMFTVAMLALATFWWGETPHIELTGRLAFALGLTALVCTALAYMVQTWAQRHTTPTRTALVFALEPVSAAVTAYLWAGERLSGRGWTGALLILAGVLAVELKPRARGRHP